MSQSLVGEKCRSVAAASGFAERSRSLFSFIQKALPPSYQACHGDAVFPDIAFIHKADAYSGKRVSGPP